MYTTKMYAKRFKPVKSEQIWTVAFRDNKSQVIGSNRIFLRCDNLQKTYSERIVNSEPVSISISHGNLSMTTVTRIFRDNTHDWLRFVDGLRLFSSSESGNLEARLSTDVN
ncbi:hypothetical protein T11_1604, partial [Trichinella zimbabwensis]